MVRATDKLGLKTVKVSVPIFVDETGPVFNALIAGTPIPGITIDTSKEPSPLVKDDGFAKLSWKSSDPESGIARYRYAIGTVRGQLDVSDGWVTVEGLWLTVE